MSVLPCETLRVFCALLRREDVGALPVMEFGQLLGVLSERDVVRRAIGRWLNVDDTMVCEVMSTPPLTVDLGTPLPEVLETMQAHGTRHLAVTEEGHVVGMVSMRDLPMIRSIAPVHLAPHKSLSASQVM